MRVCVCAHLNVSETGGTGLGLAVSRAIVIDHGGVISAESELGRGSAIHVDLPQKAARPKAARATGLVASLSTNRLLCDLD